MFFQFLETLREMFDVTRDVMRKWFNRPGFEQLYPDELGFGARLLFLEDRLAALKEVPVNELPLISLLSLWLSNAVMIVFFFGDRCHCSFRAQAYGADVGQLPPPACPSLKSPATVLARLQTVYKSEGRAMVMDPITGKAHPLNEGAVHLVLLR